VSHPTTKTAGFDGLEVVSFESRRAREMAALITNLGGMPRVAPSVREVPLEDNPAAFKFAEQLFAGELDAVLFMTGVGTRALVEVLETRYARDKILGALRGTTVIARGPKPVKVLREFQVPITFTVPEPNTWREILQELDDNPRGVVLEGSRIAVQEYGVPNEPFLAELRERGAEVLRVPVYRWTLPEDLTPLEEALEAILVGGARVVLFTNAAQVDHVLRVARQKGLEEQVGQALRSAVVGSVGPTCSEALAACGIPPDFEPEHPKMGALVHEAARLAGELLRQKSQKTPGRLESVKVLEKERAVTQSALWKDCRFLKACRREPVDATPVWLMRQAGRYLKEYRELRARMPFLELCRNPELVSEITVTAARRLGVDAAIIFADLLLIVEPLGFELEYDRGEGPAVRPVLRETSDIDRMQEVDPLESLGYLFDAIRQTRRELDPKIPLIGFTGAPFTVASYIIEGGASKIYRHTKTLMYRDVGAWRALMERLAHNLARYVQAQIAAGVQAVQVFDTWVGCLSPADYREFVQPYSRMLFEGLTPGVPLIHFGTGTSMLLEDMRAAGGNVIGLDWHVELDQAWARLGYDIGVQGNLDPMVLCAGLPEIRRQVERILHQAAGRPGHIFNLGHGILPDTPYENVLALVEIVHEISSKQTADGPAG